VIDIILGVAGAHPKVLKIPPPRVLLLGFGDSSINFELRTWSDHSTDWPTVKSELAIAVYHAIRAAGISIPFPQREIRLLNNSAEQENKTAFFEANSA